MPGRPPVDKDKMRQLHDQGVSVKAIAERTGCSKGAVYAALKLKKQGRAK